MSDSIEDDDQLSEETSEASDHWCLLVPAIDFNDILLHDCFNWLGRFDESLFNCILKLLALSFLSCTFSLLTFRKFLSLLLSSCIFSSLLSVSEHLSVFLNFLYVVCSRVFDKAGKDRVWIGVVTLLLLRELLSLLQNPWHHFTIEHLLSEAITEVTNVFEQNQSIAFKI